MTEHWHCLSGHEYLHCMLLLGMLLYNTHYIDHLHLINIIPSLTEVWTSSYPIPRVGYIVDLALCHPVGREIIHTKHDLSLSTVAVGG